MAVENSEAPGREHQQPRAGEQDAHQPDSQLPLGAAEAGRDAVDQVRRREHSGQHQDRRDQSQNRGHGARHVARLLVVLARQQAGIDRDEGCGKHPFAKQVLQKVGNAEGGVEGVGGVGNLPEVVREDALADQPDQAAEQDAGGHQERQAAGAGLAARRTSHLRKDTLPGRDRVTIDGFISRSVFRV